MVPEQNTVKEAYFNKENSQFQQLLDKGLVMSGNAGSSVCILKGQLTQKDKTALLSGRDGDALRAALKALGYEPYDWVAFATSYISDADIPYALLRQAVSACSPAVVILCDGQAVNVFRDAWADELSALPELDDALMAPGKVVRLLGMRVLNLNGFESSLQNPAEKQEKWAWLKQIPCQTKPY